jgi:hypothetical protein
VGAEVTAWRAEVTAAGGGHGGGRRRWAEVTAVGPRSAEGDSGRRAGGMATAGGGRQRAEGDSGRRAGGGAVILVAGRGREAPGRLKGKGLR